ncbi:hypothetical protein BD410DRAFT_779769 [Rickenella mellea]|uniref:Uncharacterized protein n=1 Tax=Rickenella mellea TaxID=50990 RepID=A0A4R5XE69_9AGAM|nr:hypothetical protein BD410DRAFT_779769 [Rickenella mellea]
MSSSPSTPTGRRKPHCSQCGSPMLGHKRGKCTTPSSASPSISAKPDQGDVTLATEALAGLRILSDNVATDQTPKKSATPKRRVLQELRVQTRNVNQEQTSTPKNDTTRRRASAPLEKAETLASLSPDDKALLEALNMPGVMKDDYVVVDEEERKAGVHRWLQSVPCSASGTPSKEVFDAATNPDAEIDIHSVISTAKPGRSSSSVEDRAAFLDMLVEKSKAPVASVFTVDLSDIRELEESAKKLKFHARVIVPKYSDGTTGEGWLVIGRDEKSVKSVFDQVEKDVKSSDGSFRVALKSGAVGAATAWLCLAYS